MARRSCISHVVLAAALALLLFQVTAAEPKNEEDFGDVSRIVGGQEASSTQFPWQVSTVSRKEGDDGNYTLCGGSIISTTWVMSAAHCFTKDVNDHEFEVAVLRIHIFAGMTDIPKRTSEPISIINKDEFDEHLFIYPDYKKGAEYNNDIALIKLKNQLTLTDKVQPIALATSDDFIAGKKLTASGFGQTYTEGKTSNILLYVDGLNLISREECVDINGYYREHITENMLCHRTTDRHFCHGDSGGAVVTGRGNSSGPPYVQIGIASLIGGGCENNHLPDVFVDVAKYTGWIIHIMFSVDDCTDRAGETKCERWAGYCEQYVDTMTKYCEKTCNNCLSALCTPPCVNGTCIAPNTCSCKQGWEGPQCQNALCTPPCVNGSCIAPNTCSCKQGWEGPQCQNALCTPPCVNGTCITPNTCSCKQGWEGPQCQNALCTPPCVNGTCIAPNTCSCKQGWEGPQCQNGIFGGQETSSTQFPWHVSVEAATPFPNKPGVYNHIICGGSIISTTWVMSSAYCFTKHVNDHEFEVGDFSRIYIFAGVTDKSKKDSDPDVQINFITNEEFDDHLFIYPDYMKGTTYNNDITLIKLKNQLTLTDTVQPIALATSHDFIPGKKLIVSGWGDSSNILLYVDGLNLLSREECVDIMGSDSITENMLCHIRTDRHLCKGDSGGPVVTGSGNSSGPPYVQIGIVSWSLQGSCESNDFPNVFVDVAKYTGWINHIMYTKCSDKKHPSWTKDQSCKYYADQGWCEEEKYVAKMEYYCKKTCDKCPGVKCTDIYYEASCKTYADLGWCEEEQYVDTMTYYCKKTCNKCQC